MVFSGFVDILCEFVCVFIETMILIASQKWKPNNNTRSQSVLQAWNTVLLC